MTDQQPPAIITTHSGVAMDLLNPDPKLINIDDIAHGLSMLCRFNGQCKEFYSVAEHSVWVSKIIEPRFALAGLLHDAAEAYLGDVPTPLKSQLPVFKAFEIKMEVAIAKAFDIQAYDLACPQLKKADEQLFADEWAQMMDAKIPEGSMDPIKRDFELLLPGEAKQKFLDRFAELTA